MSRVIVKKDYEEMSREAAGVIKETIDRNPEAVIVLATGHSPLRAYRILVQMQKEEGLDVKGVTFVKLDEWGNLPPDSEATCEFFLRKEILEPLGVSEEKYLHFSSDTKDMEKECARVQEEYDKLPIVDLVILGIGKNGHLGLNEPDEKLQGKAHVACLTEKTKTHELLTHTSQAVTKGMTLGMENLFRAEKILLLADGEEKEEGLKSFLSDEISTSMPVSLLKLHKNCECIINGESFPHR